VTTLVAGLGLSSIAIALAVQNILGDLFASFSIIFDKPFVIVDFIIVGEFLGTVEYVGLKTTRIRSLSGEQLIFSNGDLLKSRIRNFKRMFERRVVFTISVLYQTDYEAFLGNPLLSQADGHVIRSPNAADELRQKISILLLNNSDVHENSNLPKEQLNPYLDKKACEISHYIVTNQNLKRTEFSDSDK
jgi:hypothetical protein